MTAMINFSYFKTVFQDNINKRSRSAKGVSDISTSPKKKKMLKEGEELKIQVRKNTDNLIDSVWMKSKFRTALIPKNIQTLSEHWDSIINRELVNPDFYKEERGKLQKKAEELHIKEGRDYTINPRFRVWDAPYTTLKLSPLELDQEMKKFYRELALKIGSFKQGLISLPRILAYADLMIDSAIHPWADGCARNATATVMWLSLITQNHFLPILGTREEHYRSITNLETHTKYFERCLCHLSIIEVLFK